MNTRRLQFIQASWLGLLLALLNLSWTATAQATTITVTTLADASGGTACTLRDAITAANTDSPAGGCVTGSGSDTINFSVSGSITLGGRLSISSTVTLDGTGQSVTLSGNLATGVIRVNRGATLYLQNLTIANGADTFGGGIQNNGNLTVSHCTFSNNTADFGGGIQNDRTGTATVSNSTFFGNAVGSGGGAINNDGILTVVNSTLSGNAGPFGGGIRNTTGSGTGPGMLNIANTILANSQNGRDCQSDSGTVNGSGVNLIEVDACFVPGALSGDPNLGPLADNGGSTMTLALLPGSPALDAGDNTVCAASPVNNLDQRGQPRPADGDGDGMAVCDIGAYERTVLFPFSGFFEPVNNLPVVNTLKAGSAVPVKFSLDGNRGPDIFASGYPVSQQMNCESGEPEDPVEQTVAAGGSSLSYDPASDTYTYVWKTNKSWAGTCRQLIVKLTDGTYHLANFRFR